MGVCLCRFCLDMSGGEAFVCSKLGESATGCYRKCCFGVKCCIVVFSAV